jgi:hypothetical protein
MRLRTSIAVAALTLAACSAGNELPSGTTSSSGDESSSSAASSSAASSTAASSSAASSSSASSSAASSSASSSSGAGGAGGGSSASSATAASGSSGVGGSGGAGGAGPTGTLLVLAGPDQAAAHFTPAAGWTVEGINLVFSGASLTPYETGALAVGRRVSGLPNENDQLMWSVWKPGVGFGAVAPVNTSYTIGIPALGSFGFAALAVWISNDNKHYYAQIENGVVSPTTYLPAGMPQQQAFGPSAPTLATSSNSITVAVVYAGADSHAYHAEKNGPGSQWTPSGMVPGSLIENTIPPVAIADSTGLQIFYVRQSDKRICTIKYTMPQNFWGAEEVLNTNAITGMSPSVTVTTLGDVLITWHGFNNEGIYYLRGKSNAWGAPVAVEVPATTSSRPVAVRGLAGADTELLYATGGKLKHARVNGGAAVITATPVQSTVTNVAATIVP